MEVILSYPYWYLLLCVGLGLAYAFLLYYRNTALSEIKKPLQVLLFAFRTLTVAIIAFLLLEPLIKHEERTVNKPVIVLLQDNSRSVIMTKDSAYFRSNYKTDVNALKDKIGNDFEIQSYTFGERLSDDFQVNFTENMTDMSGAIDEIHTRYFNRNLGAVIIAGDGIYNKGKSPLVSIKKLKKVPVYTIGLGDTNMVRDLIIADVLYNKTAFLGNDFPVEVVIDAKKLRGSKSVVKISEGKNLIAAKDFTVPNENYSTAFPFTIPAKIKGMHKYTIEVTPVSGELTHLNNKRVIYVNVQDNKQKILILANSPHPDIAAVRYALESSESYDVETKLFSEFNGNVSGYNLLILHQLPSLQTDAKNIITNARSANLPMLFVIGAQSSINNFNAIKTGVMISNSGRATMNNAQPSLNTGFNLFTLEDKTRQALTKFPPLSVPFGDYKASAGVNILFNQKIGSVVTPAPLYFFNRMNDLKIGVICGEGLWRWKINDKDNIVFNEIMQKTVQYLATTENKSFFRVYHKTEFTENENVLFDAELYNQTYELINTPDVDIIIKKDGKVVKTDKFSRPGNAYRHDAGKLEPGEYTYEAKTEFSGKSYSKTGEFTISALNMELTNATADHQLMFAMADESGGKFFHYTQMKNIIDAIKAKEDIVDTTETRKKLSDLLNMKWLFFIIISLLGIEWFLRKRNGIY